MRIVTYAEAHNSFKSLLDSVIDGADIAIIHRRDHENAVVMSQSQYERMLETLHLTSSRRNLELLLAPIDEDKRGQTTVRKLAKVK
jgi:antitoxin YefM